MTVEIPSDWNVIDGTESNVGPRLVAAPGTSWFTPSAQGLFFEIGNPDLTIGDRIGADLSSCSETRGGYSDGIYQGDIFSYINCAGGESYTVIDVFEPLFMIIAVRTMIASDVDALNHILATFKIDSSKLPQ